MRIRSFALWAALGVASSSAAAMAIPVDAPARATSGVTRFVAQTVDASHFSAGQTLTIDARLGRASVARGADGETLLFASVTGADTASEMPPIDLAIVVDRSGSMAGLRLSNAIAAAIGAVERMRDVDTVTVVAFDSTARVVVPKTRVTASARADIEQQIRGIRLGGETCISCGLDAAMTALGAGRESGQRRDSVSRVLLLSDGEATEGIKDVAGLRAMAAQMRERGFAISTIGVDVNYDEKTMTAIAQESNGRHYFVANPTGLPAIFNDEFDSLATTVARDADLVVELPPGIEVDQVFDRSFRREPGRIVVPFGTFAAKQEKTVLIKLRVPTGREGIERVAGLKLAYRDLSLRADASCEGTLGIDVRADGTEQRDLDPFVAARLERARVGQALTTANDLFERGRLDEARALLKKQESELRTAQSLALAHAADPTIAQKDKGRNLHDDFDEQEKVLARAQTNFAPKPTAAGAPAAPPAPTSTAGRAAVRENSASKSDLSF